MDFLLVVLSNLLCFYEIDWFSRLGDLGEKFLNGQSFYPFVIYLFKDFREDLLYGRGSTCQKEGD